MKSIFWLVVVGALSQALTACSNIPTQSASSQAPVAVAALVPAPPQQPEQIVDTASVTPLPPVAVLNTINTLQTADLWQRIRNGFKMPGLDTDLVHEQERWYATRPEYLARMTERSKRYLHHITNELEARGMPTELALLPFIESAYNPQAVSSAKAAGMWQFMPGTGKDFELTQNHFRDDRRDVLGSTRAALAYLEHANAVCVLTLSVAMTLLAPSSAGANPLDYTYEQIDPMSLPFPAPKGCAASDSIRELADRVLDRHPKLLPEQPIKVEIRYFTCGQSFPFEAQTRTRRVGNHTQANILVRFDTAKNPTLSLLKVVTHELAHVGVAALGREQQAGPSGHGYAWLLQIIKAGPGIEAVAFEQVAPGGIAVDHLADYRRASFAHCKRPSCGPQDLESSSLVSIQ